MDCGSMGGEVGAETCLSGTVTKYDNCKPCPNLGTLTSCPSPYTCTYEECSNRYYKSGCQSGYDWDSTSQTCTQQCSTSYKYTCTGSNESPKGTACNEKYTSCQCDLGYEWSGGKCVACNSSYYKFTCANTGGGVGESCGGLYSGCRCGPSRVWNGETCISTRCQTVYNHDKLYSDMTPESDNDFAVPIAQIVCSYEDGGGQALALNSVGSFKIGGYGTDISSLPNYSLSSAGQDLASCENSKIIMASGNKNTYPAVWAAHEYSTEGTEAGDWCLPAAGIFAYARQECLGSYFEVCIRENYVTSTEIDSTSQWVSAGDQQEYGYKDYYTGLLNSFKTASYSVLPVIPFCPEGKIYDKTTNSCVTCDSSYQYTCYGAQGYAGGVGKACSGKKGSSGKYKSCNCKDNFVWNGSACVFQNACTQGKELGYILYSDMTRSANLVSGKTPIGVVICSYANGGGQAAALKSLSSGSPWYYSSNYTAAKISNIKRYSNYKEASQDVASCENSRIIMAAGDKSYYPAVWAVNEYSTEGTNPGDWCLPAAGVYSAYTFYYSKIESTLKKLGSSIGGMWTSTVGNSVGYYTDYKRSYETYGLSDKAGIQVAGLHPVIEF